MERMRRRLKKCPLKVVVAIVMYNHVPDFYFPEGWFETRRGRKSFGDAL